VLAADAKKAGSASEDTRLAVIITIRPINFLNLGRCFKKSRNTNKLK